MITEDYVSYKIAKLLKEKGFNESCFYYYKDKVLMFSPFLKGRNSYQTDTYSAPTHQMAMKWLRETYNVNPVPYALSLGWAFDIFDLMNRDITGCKKLYSMDFPSKSEVYANYEEACEAAIKYCLENLI